jgi:hypothetical protein
MCRAFFVDSARRAGVIHNFAPVDAESTIGVSDRWQSAGMGVGQQPFIGAEALTSGDLTRYELRRYYRAIMPNVYLDKRVEPSLDQRTAAAWLWSGREAVVAGLAASALHGAKWIDNDAPVELIWHNARSPNGVVTRDQLLLENEIERLDGLAVTSPERTAFDIGRRVGSMMRSLAWMRWRRPLTSRCRRSKNWSLAIDTRVVYASSKQCWT